MLKVKQLQNVTYTPDEARRVHEGQDVSVDAPVLERLRAELEMKTLYSEKQATAIQALLTAWDGTDHEWHSYIARAHKRFNAELKLKSVHDQVGNPSYWVRALGVFPAFKDEVYASVLREEHH